MAREVASNEIGVVMPADTLGTHDIAFSNQRRHAFVFLLDALTPIRNHSLELTLRHCRNLTGSVSQIFVDAGFFQRRWPRYRVF